MRILCLVYIKSDQLFFGRLDGTLLSLEKVWEYLIKDNATIVDKWSFLTQVEHPFFANVCYWIHPCRTAAWMADYGTGQYITRLVTTLSTVVKLELPEGWTLKI